VSDYHLELSRVFRDLNLRRQQKAELETALRLDPKSSSAHYALAALLAKDGETEASKAEYARVQEIKQAEVTRDIALGHMRAGVNLARNGEYAGAATEFHKAIDANPQLGEAWFDLAGALMQKGDIEQALKTFPLAIKLAPRWPEAHYQFAQALLKANRRDEAVAELRLALKQDPNHLGAKRALEQIAP
jgi:tetratricopeptide (TPR) repeat protein